MLEVDMAQVGGLVRGGQVPEQTAKLVDAYRVKVLRRRDVWRNGKQACQGQNLSG